MAKKNYGWMFLKWLVKTLLKIIVVILWGASRLLEVVFHHLGKWLKEYIS